MSDILSTAGRKEIILRARVKSHHEQRVIELCEKYNLSVSDLIRSLIENAEIKERPVLSSSLFVDTVK